MQPGALAPQLSVQYTHQNYKSKSTSYILVCFIFPEMASTQAAKKVGPCGGTGGQPKDMNVDGITRIVKITVRHGWSVDAFTVRFLRNGREESTELWGGQGGNVKEFELQPTEYITSLKGYYGTYNGMVIVRSIKFVTNLKTSETYGREEGVPFELHAVTGQIIGFHARAGQLIDAIGVYIKADNTAGGSNAGGNTGGNTGGSTGTAGQWTQSDGNFWDRPVSGA